MSNIQLFATNEHTIRATNDGRFSVYDVLVAFGVTKNRKHANETYTRIVAKHSEVSSFCGYFKFPGRGQRETPITDREGMYQILMLCPGNKAAEFRKWAAGVLADPDKAANHAIEMYRKQGRSDKWIKTRLDGLQIRHQFTDTLKQHGIVKPGHYAACTDAINKPLLGGTAKEVKQQRGLTKRQPLRNELSQVELSALNLAEAIASERIEKEERQGFNQCRDACSDAGDRVKRVFE